MQAVDPYDQSANNNNQKKNHDKELKFQKNHPSKVGTFLDKQKLKQLATSGSVLEKKKKKGKKVKRILQVSRIK